MPMEALKLKFIFLHYRAMVHKVSKRKHHYVEI